MKKFSCTVYIFLLGGFVSTAVADTSIEKNPYIAGALASFFPGAGHYYNGDLCTGLSSSVVWLAELPHYYCTTESFSKTACKENAYFASVNICRFSAYDAFQSTLSAQQRQRLLVNIPHYSFTEMVTCAFDKRAHEPGIWGVIPVTAMLVAPTILVAKNGINKHVDAGLLAASVPLILLQSTLFAVGEESYFRGFVYPACAQLTGSKWLGNTLQAMYFGFCHTSVSQDWGLRQFPHGVGTALHFTSTINMEKEYDVPETEAANFVGMNDAGTFAVLSLLGFAMGYVSSESEDGLLKSTFLHTLITSGAIMKDLLIEGHTGRFMMGVSFSF